MRTEQELRDFLKRCNEVSGFGMSDGNCPMTGTEGCCAECTTPSAIEWVLGESNNGAENGQNKLINALVSAGSCKDAVKSGN